MKNQFGMSLVEVLVSMAIAGIVSMGVMQLNKNMFDSQKKYESSADFYDFKNLTKMYLGNKNNCLGFFDELGDLSNNSPKKIGNWNVGEKVSPNLTLESIKLDPYDSSTGQVKLNFSLIQKNGIDPNSERAINFDHAILVTLDPTKTKVVSCDRDDKETIQEIACSTLGGTWNIKMKSCDQSQQCGDFITEVQLVCADTPKDNPQVPCPVGFEGSQIQKTAGEVVGPFMHCRTCFKKIQGCINLSQVN